MKRTAVIFAALLSLMLLASCGKGVRVVYERPAPSAAQSGKSWTVLVYMIGGSEETLNGTMSDKIEAITSLDYPSNINVAIETGGSADWHIKGIYNDYIQRFEAAGNGKMFLADQMQTVSMGDYRSLTEFIMWGASHYRTDNYMLILAGAGGGSMYGIGSDELFEYDSLDIDEISYALSVAGTKFEIVGMDASLMGSIETATGIANYTDYLVAPQDVQNADCWDYADFLGELCENTDMDGAELGRTICDGYYQKIAHQGGEKYAAMSVIDTSNITTLNQAFDGMAGDMLIATDSLDNYKSLRAALAKTRVYGGASDDEGYSDLVDLGDMASKCAEQVGTTAATLISELENTVVYSVRGSYQRGATGLSVYYPLDMDSGHLQQYMDMSHGSKYKEFLRKICINSNVTDNVTNTADYTSSWVWTSYVDDMSWLEYKSILENNSYELHVTGNMDLFSGVRLNVYSKDKKSGRYVFIGNCDDIDEQWDAGIFKAAFSCRLPELAGMPVTMSLVRSYDSYDVYSVPVLVNGEVASIRIKYENGSYDILGCWGTLDGNGLAVSALRKLKASDKITPMLAVLGEHDERSYILGKPKKKLWRGIKKGKTEDGEYTFEFVMTDIYGLERYGTAVTANISGKNIVYN